MSYYNPYMQNQFQQQQPNPVINIGNQPQQPQQQNVTNSLFNGVNQQELNFMQGFMQSNYGKEAMAIQQQKIQEYITHMNGTNNNNGKDTENAVFDDKLKEMENRFDDKLNAILSAIGDKNKKNK